MTREAAGSTKGKQPSTDPAAPNNVTVPDQQRGNGHRDPDLFHVPLPGLRPPPVDLEELLTLTDDLALTPAELRVLLAIRARYSSDHRFFGSVRQLAAALGRSVGSIGKTVAELRRRGYLELDDCHAWRVRVSRTRSSESNATRSSDARDPFDSGARSVRVSRTPTPPKGGVGGTRAVSKGRRRAPTPRAEPPRRVEHPVCRDCDSTGFLEGTGGWARCPFCNPQGVTRNGTPAD